MRIEVVAVQLLEHAADRAVQLEPLRGGEVVVERLANELVDERVATRSGRVLCDHAGRFCIREHVEQSRYAKLARTLEHSEVELAPDDGGHVECLHRVVGQVRHPPSQQRPQLLRDPAHRIVGDHPHDLT